MARTPPHFYDEESRRTIVPDTTTPPSRVRGECPACGCLSVVDLCFYFWGVTPTARAESLGDKHAATDWPAWRDRSCDMLICFVCHTRQHVNRGRMWQPDPATDNQTLEYFKTGER